MPVAVTSQKRRHQYKTTLINTNPQVKLIVKGQKVPLLSLGQGNLINDMKTQNYREHQAIPINEQVMLANAISRMSKISGNSVTRSVESESLKRKKKFSSSET